ncbi:hypothetical protein [Roseovarius sp. Pro17]|uniref:hypothetical protein n=1 Tax=Roseovarius sp. Pro17 TaxID=3108175 RepID=UPI002D77D3EA|nr:hypothetical protein [Roseovarius sp. Pro17]
MDPDLTPTFNALRPLYSRHAETCVVMSDTSERYWLGTHEQRARDGYRTDFGGVQINKAYVSAHLMPVYIHPDMLEGHSPDLKKRMQGKSCFNFKKPDARLFEELDQLITTGIARFQQDGRL